MSNVTIISLGGSMIFPDDKPDVEFLKKFKEIIVRHIKEGKKFMLITGGGRICRHYQNALGEFSDATNEDRDWVGIAATQMNAHFVKKIFKEYSSPQLYLDPHELTGWPEEYSVIMGAGWKPGVSSDYDAVLMAKPLRVDRIINLSNIDFVYDKDPNKFTDAKKLENITWKEYQSYIPTKWSPGLSTPFDPKASELAEKEGLSVAIIGGKNFDSFENCLNDKEFEGTLIRP